MSAIHTEDLLEASFSGSPKNPEVFGKNGLLKTEKSTNDISLFLGKNSLEEIAGIM